jgi:hypothetical protein
MRGVMGGAKSLDSVKTKEKQGHPLHGCIRDENGTEIFRIDHFRFLYYEPFFNTKNCQFQLVSQPFSTIFCTL